MINPKWVITNHIHKVRSFVFFCDTKQQYSKKWGTTDYAYYNLCLFYCLESQKTNFLTLIEMI